MIPIVNNNFVFDSYIGNQVVELEARVNQLKIFNEDTRDSISALSEDYYYFHEVINHQSKQIKNLTEILTRTTLELKKLTLKKKSICTHLSGVTKSHLKLKKQVIDKFAEYDQILDFVVQQFNKLSLN